MTVAYDVDVEPAAASSKLHQQQLNNCFNCMLIGDNHRPKFGLADELA